MAVARRQYFGATDPQVVGNDYMVLGTMEKPAWKRGTEAPLSLQEMVENMHDFKQVLEFKVTGGWVRASNESGSRTTGQEKDKAPR